MKNLLSLLGITIKSSQEKSSKETLKINKRTIIKKEKHALIFKRSF